MQELSLLYPEGKKSSAITLGEETCNDLSIEHICEKISGDTYEQNIIRNIMIKLEHDPEIIRYRRDVFDDMYHYPKLRERIKELLDELAYLKELERSVKDATSSPVWQLINRLQELDIYVNCISGINQSLTEHDIHSEGLKKLKNFVNAVYSESGFEHLNEDIKNLVSEIGRIKSISLGVNLDSRLVPIEVGIVSINDTPFTKPGLLSNFLDFYSKKSEIHGGTSFDGMTKIHTVGKVSGDDPLMSNLSRVITEMLDSTVKQLKSKLSRYTNIRRRELFAEGLYNFKLAAKCVNGDKMEIIRNDIEFTSEHRIYIMTGPNRGGKTTLTQAVGHAFLFAQNGLYAPAEKMTFSPVDCIYTHFPADENKTVDLGRLGEESKRMSEIFAKATNESLLLFNESLATTSFAEGLYIAKDIVKALKYLGARTVFNTHMHELAMNLDELNTQIDGDSNVASLITGIHEGKRSYKIFIAPPEGVSYAQDIAKKYGVTFDQLMNRINGEKN